MELLLNTCSCSAEAELLYLRTMVPIDEKGNASSIVYKRPVENSAAAIFLVLQVLACQKSQPVIFIRGLEQ